MFVIGIEIVDIFISLFYILLIFGLFSLLKNSLTNQYSKNYYYQFLFFKILCAILFCILHIYIYRGGDTFLYFAGGNLISEQIVNNPLNTFSYLFGDYHSYKEIIYTSNYSIVNYFRDPSTLLMCQITSLFSLITFNNYLASTILISCFSFIGIWLLYSTLCSIYPKLNKFFAICILFYPSIGIWGSGILKDTVTIAAVGFIFFAVYNFLSKKNIILSVILLLVSVLFCMKLKPYILYTFIPSILIWVQAKLSSKIKSGALNIIFTPFLIAIVIIGGYFFLQNISEGAGKYSIDNVQSVAEGFQSWHSYLAETRDQSGYTLGEFEFTATGILKKSPEAFFVTYYRPFPFIDTRNFATFFEAIQSFTLLCLTIYVLLKVGVLKFFRICIFNPEVRAFMVFAITLGIAVGLTSYNFGALSRYKIPCLPFYTSALAIIYFQIKNKKTT